MHEIAANLGPLVATLEGMRRASVPAVTLLSSGGTVYGPDAPTPTPETAPLWPISTYGVLKVAAERYVGLYARQHGLAADILRCANVYGPGEPTHGSQGLIGVTRAAIRAHRPVVVYGDGSARRDFVHVDDVAETVVALAARPDGVRVLNVGSGRSESVLEVIEAVARSLGTSADLEHRPAGPPTYRSCSSTSAGSASSSTSSPAAWSRGLGPSERPRCDISRVRGSPGCERFHSGVAVCRLRPTRLSSAGPGATRRRWAWRRRTRASRR